MAVERLEDAKMHCFAEAVEASIDVHSRQQFFVWTQSSVQGLVPHQILICGVRESSGPSLTLHHFSASRYFRQEHFDVIADPMTGLVPRLVAAAEAHHATVVFSPAVGANGIDLDLNAMVSGNELKNMAAHLVMGTRGKFEAFYAFSRVTAELDARLGYVIELMVPHLHNAFLRVLATERDVTGSQSQRAGRLVTPRQHEILSLIKAGKTNSEIAEVLSCSQWTIKNHVQAILRKLDSNTRTHAIARAMSLGILHPD